MDKQPRPPMDIQDLSQYWEKIGTEISPFFTENFLQAKTEFFYSTGKLQGILLKGSGLSSDVAKEIIHFGSSLQIKVSISEKFRNPFIGCNLQAEIGNGLDNWKSYCEGLISGYCDQELGLLKMETKADKVTWEIARKSQQSGGTDRNFVHSMNNVLGAIVSFGSLVIKDETLKSQQKERITWMIDSAQKATEMLKEQFPK